LFRIFGFQKYINFRENFFSGEVLREFSLKSDKKPERETFFLLRVKVWIKDMEA
jgi:hypothetical protein